MTTQKQIRLFVSTNCLIRWSLRHGTAILGLDNALFFIGTEEPFRELAAEMPYGITHGEGIGQSTLERRHEALQLAIRKAEAEGRVQDKREEYEMTREECWQHGLLRRFLRRRGLPYRWIICDMYAASTVVDQCKLLELWKASQEAQAAIDLRTNDVDTPFVRSGDTLQCIAGQPAIIGADGQIKQQLTREQGFNALRDLLFRQQ